MPELHKFTGVEYNVFPLSAPHVPTTAFGPIAVHDAELPPFNPGQDQVHGPEPVTTTVEPLVLVSPTSLFSALASSFFVELVMLTIGLALLLLLLALGVVVHRLEFGIVDHVIVVAPPHTPSYAPGASVLHGASMPPPVPGQVQLHGPVPVTIDAVPVRQRFEVGAEDGALPEAVPHEPLTAVIITAAEHDTALPPFDP
jgi:hypothetical protein